MGFVRHSSVLLIDEPFVGLDATGKQTLLSLVDERSAAGATLVVATHDMDILERADRAVALRNGVVVHDGTIEPEKVLGLVG